ncbi:MAG TPA: DUF2892 domain-containing protein [Bacteroidia bacterium]|nr:DUF2892 domain-containing protein [Bacteroidia bacterium]
MKKNIGTTEKIIRILVAVIIAVLYFTNQISGTIAIVLLIIAAIFIITAFLNFCPIWAGLGISTRKKN